MVSRIIIGGSAGFDIAASEDVSVFTVENLRRYAAVMFFTTGELPMNDAQKAALTGFVRAGGGFLRVHSAFQLFKTFAVIFTEQIFDFYDQRPAVAYLRYR